MSVVCASAKASAARLRMSRLRIGCGRSSCTRANGGRGWTLPGSLPASGLPSPLRGASASGPGPRHRGVTAQGVVLVPCAVVPVPVEDGAVALALADAVPAEAVAPAGVTGRLGLTLIGSGVVTGAWTCGA